MTPTKRTFHGATCRIGPAFESKHGVVEVMLFGTLTPEIYIYFQPFVIEAIRGAPAIIIRIDTALNAMATPPVIEDNAYTRENSPAQAVVIPAAARKDLWQRHTDEMNARGVVRAIFLPHEVEAAARFAEIAAAYRGKEPKFRQAVDSGPVPL